MDIQDLIARTGDYETLYAQFAVDIPQRFNMATDTVGYWAERTPDKPALWFHDAEGRVQFHSFAQMQSRAQRLAGGLRGLGITAGDRVAVFLGQGPECALAHLAVYQLGAIVAAISVVTGEDNVAHIVSDSGAGVLITHVDTLAAARRAAERAANAVHLVVVGADHAPADVIAFEQFVADSEALAVPEATSADTPALLLYTSGSTGAPKGVLHAHRLLAAYRHTIKLSFNADVDSDSVFFTYADWAWIGGLLDTLLPAWLYGCSVLAYPGRFDAETCFDLMARFGVTHSFQTPTALKRLAQVDSPRQRWDLALRVFSTGGEPLPAATRHRLETALGIEVVEFYGTTEVNHLVGSCPRVWPTRVGSMGRRYPGHNTTLIDDQGEPVAVGEVGQIAADADDPTVFLGYWNQPEKTAGKFFGRWSLTGDLARQDADGYFYYLGRADDMIKSGGYRISPNEIEEALMDHPAVAEAAVIGVPDPDRYQIVKAWIRVHDGYTGSAALTTELQRDIARRLGAYKRPRVIEYVTQFPMTGNGKIRRSELQWHDRTGGHA